MPMADEEDAPEGDDEAETAEGEDGGDELSATEATAREQGWKPKDKWKGDTSRWTDAETFLERTKPAKIRESVDELTRENRDLKKQLAAEKVAFEQRLGKMESLNKVQRRKMYAEIEGARRAAVEVGDTAEYDRQNEMEQQLYQAEQEAGKTTAKEEPAAPKADNPEILQWISENSWFNKSPMLTKAAEGISQQLAEDEPGLTLKENLAKTRAEVIKRYPERFSKAPAKTNGNGNGHSAVESGQRAAGGTNGKAFIDIPSQERALIEEHIKEGLYKDKADETIAQQRAKAAKAYWS